MSLPANLSYFVSRMAGTSVNYFRLDPQNGDSSSPNKICRIALPANALCSLKSFALHFYASCTGANQI